MAEKTDEAQFKSFDEDIKIFFDELCDSNGNINTENEENFKNPIKNGLMVSLKDR